MAKYDIIGNIVIVKFSRDDKLSDKKKEYFYHLIRAEVLKENM